MSFLSQTVVFIFSFLLYTSYPYAKDKEQCINDQVQTVYHNLSPSMNSTMTSRLDAISSQFLGKPYVLHSLGDGAMSLYDEAPIYRLDAFDCETYVTTVLALSFARDPKQFRCCLLNIRYKKGKAGYLSRNHFTSADWNTENQNLGYIKDITQNIKDAHQQPVALMAEAYIDKPSWYAHHRLDAIRLAENNPLLQKKRLLELQAKGAKEPRMMARIAYVPLTVLFDEKKNPNMTIFNQIPNGAIIEIVRPNWDLREQIGTHLNVSHMGFAFWKGKNLIFRQATSLEKKVVDVSLITYLQQTLASPTIKGINIEVVVPEKPFGCCYS